MAKCKNDYRRDGYGWKSIHRWKITHKPHYIPKMKRVKIIALTVLLVTSLTTLAKADQNILLTIDISNPSAVIFTATTNYALANDATTTANDGIDLLGFLKADVSYGGAIRGTDTLTGGGSGTAYSQFVQDNASTSGGASLDLNFYGVSSTAQTFSTGATALTGTLTADLSGILLELPGAGDHGDLMAGYSQNVGPVIGQWQVIGPVPEPGTLALAGLGSVSALFYARRRK